ncbi:hypothetical protein ABZZ36_18350 [Actinacidiphila glaucinigra]|uniref:hypothetical protein n=1 Tax=Actinacidiphila glaucinigra TaxID=235986 RepID=UPI0033BCC384
MTEQWTTDHKVTLLAQVESRPAAADSQGQRWMERRHTGLVLAACNCGWTTGWVPKDQMPSTAELLGRHGVPMP